MSQATTQLLLGTILVGFIIAIAVLVIARLTLLHRLRKTRPDLWMSLDRPTPLDMFRYSAVTAYLAKTPLEDISLRRLRTAERVASVQFPRLLVVLIIGGFIAENPSPYASRRYLALGLSLAAIFAFLCHALVVSAVSRHRLAGGAGAVTSRFVNVPIAEVRVLRNPSVLALWFLDRFLTWGFACLLIAWAIRAVFHSGA